MITVCDKCREGLHVFCEQPECLCWIYDHDHMHPDVIEVQEKKPRLTS